MTDDKEAQTASFEKARNKARINTVIAVILTGTVTLFYQACGYLGDSGNHMLDLPSEGSEFAILKSSILDDNCIVCHSGAAPSGSYDMSSYAGLMAGGKVIPGDPANSPLIKVLKDGTMPPGGSLPAKDIAALEAWIAAGATDEIVGGGGAPGGDPTTSPTPRPTAIPEGPPIVNAGPDQTVALPKSSLSIIGTARDNDGNITRVEWKQVSGPTVSISGAASMIVTLSNLVAGTYVLEFTAFDDDNESSSDTVQIVVTGSSGNTGGGGNQAPTVNAGADKTIALPTDLVSVTGTASDADGSIKTIAWTQVSGPNTARISSATSLTTQFQNLIEGTYTFQLKVTDNLGLTATDSVMVKVNPEAVQITPTYTWLAANVFPKCLSCHGATNASGGYRFNTYANAVRAVVSGNASGSKLYQAVNSNAMPSGGPPLTAAQKETIRQWINNGAQNN